MPAFNKDSITECDDISILRDMRLYLKQTTQERTRPDMGEVFSSHAFLEGLQAAADRLSGQPGATCDSEVSVGDRRYRKVCYMVAATRCMRIYGFDITAHRQAEIALKDNERRLQTIFDLAPVGMVIANENRLCLEANRSFRQMLGYTLVELGRLTLLDITHPADREEGRRAVMEVARGERDHVKMEKRFLRKDGSRVWAAITVSAVRDSEGRLLYFIGMVEDISVRRETERELEDYRKGLERLVDERTVELERKNARLTQEIGDRRRAEEMLAQQAAFALNNPAPVMQIRTDGTVIGSNPAAEEIFGRTVTGNRVSSLLPTLAPAVLKEITPESGRHFEESIGNRTYVFTVRRDAATDSMFVYGADITERHRMEEQLRKLSHAVEQSPSTIVITDQRGPHRVRQSEVCAAHGLRAERGNRQRSHDPQIRNPRGGVLSEAVADDPHGQGVARRVLQSQKKRRDILGISLHIGAQKRKRVDDALRESRRGYHRTDRGRGGAAGK